jgi:UDP-N-acetylglucosamine--N-acetylmuramyl-(pentapeptide) pyrophosphoryl-undecaprenol N-acetylglucosamine transferase
MTGAPILLAAGATGGHLFPAEALASVLRARGRTLILVTDSRGHAYAERFPGIEMIEVRSASPSGKSVGGKIEAAVELVRGGFDALALIRRTKPGAVVGFGGYPALPLCAAAGLSGTPLSLHE